MEDPIFGHKRTYLVLVDVHPPQRDWYFTGFGTSPIADDCDFVRVMHGLNAAGFCPNQWYQCTDT